MGSQIAYDFADKIIPILWSKPTSFYPLCKLCNQSLAYSRDANLVIYKEALKKASLSISGNMWVPVTMSRLRFYQ